MNAEGLPESSPVVPVLQPSRPSLYLSFSSTCWPIADIGLSPNALRRRPATLIAENWYLESAATSKTKYPKKNYIADVCGYLSVNPVTTSNQG